MKRPLQVLLFTIVATTASSLYLEGGLRTLQGSLSSLNQGARNQAAALQQKLSPSSSRPSKPVTDDRINDQLCEFWQQQDASHRRRQESLRRYCGISGQL